MRVARVACVSCAAAVLVAHVAWECVRGSCDTCVLLCAAAVLVPTHTHLAHGLRVCVCVPSRVSCAVLGDIYVKAEWACVCAVPCLLFAVLGNPYVKVECCVCVCNQQEARVTRVLVISVHTFRMLKPTVGIMSSEKPPVAMTFTCVKVRGKEGERRTGGEESVSVSSAAAYQRSLSAAER